MTAMARRARPLWMGITNADDLRNVLARVIARQTALGRPVGDDLVERFLTADHEHRALCQRLGEQLGVHTRQRETPADTEGGGTTMISTVNSI